MEFQYYGNFDRQPIRRIPDQPWWDEEDTLTDRRLNDAGASRRRFTRPSANVCARNVCDGEANANRQSSKGARIGSTYCLLQAVIRSARSAVTAASFIRPRRPYHDASHPPLDTLSTLQRYRDDRLSR
ncbi:hypothetical protein RR46_04454 [Papilio xuthus]|uniref:Uncharacterized protein n=1 Tax=Papilio xuthus TaxID=66420 RepID=A0A194PLS3_PAPXU|nr:hypothetical protein RR46_04454 [Papilio xuthus]